MKRNLPTIILLTSGLLISIARIHIAVVRFIDPDEFAYLHWTYLMASGSIPYRDFFLYHIPLFQFLLTPIFYLPYSSFLIYLARFWELAIYGATLCLFTRFAFITVKSKIIVLLSLLLFLIFPMTLDKTIDIRPDMLMMLFFLISTLIAWRESITFRQIAFIGLSFGLSLMVFPKIIFAVPSLIAILVLKHKHVFQNIKSIGILTAAAALPFIIFFLYLVSTGTVYTGIESITQAAWAVSAGKIPFSPWLALSPWPVVYVEQSGVSLPWLVNTAIWILAIPGLFLIWKKNKNAGIFLGVFFAFAVFFLFAFPAPYTQYFLPLSLFACFLAALTIYSGTEFLNKFGPGKSVQISTILLSVISVILLTSFYLQYRERIGSTNVEQLSVIDMLLTISKPDETFYDMVGSYVFRPDGYLICCHPYGEFVDKLKKKPPTLRQSLIANKTKFIILDRTGQSFWKPIPEDLTFLFTHYIDSPYKKIYVLGSKFNCSNGSCNQININNQPIVYGSNSFEITVEENYKVESIPVGQSITINGSQVYNDTLTYTPGVYTFTVPPDVSQFQIRLAR